MNARGIVVINCRSACYRCAKSFQGEAKLLPNGTVEPDISGLYYKFKDPDKILYCTNCIHHPDTEKEVRIRIENSSLF